MTEAMIIELTKEQQEKNNEIDNARIILGQVYEDIIIVLKDYCDLKEDYYKIIAMWIIGTYCYKEFLTYPFLFFNAMRGSGKSRILNLITSLSWNGSVIASPTEAVLFRTAGHGTLGIDEFEGIMKKENQGLKEILNASYKKGMKIKRLRKKKTLDGESQVIEEFEPYCPIIMANIFGMEEVLGDRCLTLILEKSNNPIFSKKSEDFSENVMVKDIKQRLCTLQKANLVYRCSYFSEKNIYTLWNKWLNERYNYTPTYSTYTTLTTLNTPDKVKVGVKEVQLDVVFSKIDQTNINGRNLELLFPIFLISNYISPIFFDEMLRLGSIITKEKRIDEMTESNDVMVYDFISNQIEGQFYNIKELTNEFKEFTNYSKEDEYVNWLNPKWFGRALKRLELIKDKRRLCYGMEVTLNINKAKDKIKMFR